MFCLLLVSIKRGLRRGAEHSFGVLPGYQPHAVAPLQHRRKNRSFSAKDHRRRRSTVVNSAVRSPTSAFVKIARENDRWRGQGGSSVDTISIGATLPFSVAEDEGHAVPTLTRPISPTTCRTFARYAEAGSGLEESQPPRFLRLPRICAAVCALASSMRLNKRHFLQ
jgi:hypothetical protein